MNLKSASIHQRLEKLEMSYTNYLKMEIGK